jgi:hypothetical protein
LKEDSGYGYGVMSVISWLSVLLIEETGVPGENQRYQRWNQNPYIEEEHTTQWPKEKVQKDKQRSTKYINYKVIKYSVLILFQ